MIADSNGIIYCLCKDYVFPLKMTSNLVKGFFLINGLAVAFGGVLVNFFENYLPTSVSKIFRYGKFCSNVKNKFLEKLEVPKRWFKHFYTFAGPFSTAALVLVYYRYYQSDKLPDIVVKILKFLMGQPTLSLIPAENTIFALILLTIHCWKRYYETHYISVFSNAYMNFTFYIIGLFHYLGTIVSIVGESYDITKDTKVDVNWTRLSLTEYTCATVLLISTYMQYRTNIILANLRKDKKGIVVTTNYKMPEGELFNLISGPLQLTEIIIYICLSIILRKAYTFHYVSFWVIMNQVECAYLSHQWSVKTFKNYTNRKIILPFIF
ncbi:PREDICTED: polyprenol reductase [Ceratosolen solmsi marchali]|uniref:Polyprenal reductase n=1 Tax=Ceratosolen solmsi marchali TaxID=326594 RepID=A0AAJ7DZF9_9HYME|nr:PREDICTED: polyprenol reductase [Ceratosolen solmsi marchali]